MGVATQLRFTNQPIEGVQSKYRALSLLFLKNCVRGIFSVKAHAAVIADGGEHLPSVLLPSSQEGYTGIFLFKWIIPPIP